MENLPEGNTPGPNTRKMMDDFKQQGFEAIVKQLEFCNYACGAGSLTNNVAFLALKEYAPELKAEVERLKNGIRKYVHHMEKFFGEPKVGQPPSLKDLKDLL